MTLALIYILRELFGLMLHWVYKVTQLKEKKFRQIDFKDRDQLDNLAIERACQEILNRGLL